MKPTLTATEEESTAILAPLNEKTFQSDDGLNYLTLNIDYFSSDWFNKSYFHC